MLILFLLAQPLSPPAPAPDAQAAVAADIQFDAHATADRVRVVQRGQTSLTVHTVVNGRAGEGNIVDVQAPTLPPGQQELRNVDVRVHAEARLVPHAQENTNSDQEPGSDPQR